MIQGILLHLWSILILIYGLTRMIVYEDGNSGIIATFLGIVLYVMGSRRMHRADQEKSKEETP